MFDLVLIWGGIIGFIIMMYVILDGFDLGIGILFPFVRNSNQREIMMSTVVPVWDGNETWLVLGAACLYAAFPVAYSTLLPLLYIPILIMLAALVFRGIAFEFLFKAHKSRFLWVFSFAAGSILVAFAQGLILGTFIKGFGSVAEPMPAGAVQWFSGFSIMTGIAMVCGYALLGATWLITKTHGALQDKMYKYAETALVLVAIFVGIVSIWTPFTDPTVMTRWFSLPNFFFLVPLPIITGICVLYLLYALYQRHEREPFAMAILIFILSYAGLVISIFPYIIPHRTTVWQAAAPENTLVFVLIGVVILLPILLGYTFYQYRVFKGKVKTSDLHY
ncbi:MAG: cytochrome d ubiquinol oxidase subunit II [Pseudomonadota bacterium]